MSFINYMTLQVKGTRRGDPKPVLLRNGKPIDLDKMKGES